MEATQFGINQKGNGAAELKWVSDDAGGGCACHSEGCESFRMGIRLSAWLSVSGTRGESHGLHSAHWDLFSVSSHPGTFLETDCCPRHLHLSV